MFFDFAKYGAAGRWLHLFPEGGIFQNTDYSLGGRNVDENKSKIGKLKWGIGKLIAHSPNKPVVVPLYHYGMETIMPQDNSPQKKLLTVLPIPGHDVKVIFGPEIEYEDLIRDYETIHGPLWRYSSNAGTSNSRSVFMKLYDSLFNEAPVMHDSFTAENDRWREEASDAEKVLYSQITSRIETALTELNSKGKGYTRTI